MFTGLIECVGKLVSMKNARDVWELEIASSHFSNLLKRGDSVSVSGACLTVTSNTASGFSVQMMRESLEKTKMLSLKAGARVNLERALLLSQRLDGHLVAGHVDEVGSLKTINDYGTTKELVFSASPDFLSAVAPKGSVAIDGVSLTVIRSEANTFSVGVIPTTLSDTTLGELSEGDCVNLEKDLIARYVTHFLGGKTQVKNCITWDKLVEYGWSS